MNASIIWLFNNQPVSESRSHLQTNGSLYINETQPHDSGLYQCQASLGNQTIESRKARLSFACNKSTKMTKLHASKHTIMYIYFSIDLMQSFDRNPEDKTVQLGSGVIFYCINSGSLPLASISWEKDGALISNAAITSTELSSTQTSSSLLIANAQKSDEGLYKCVATNRLLSNNRVESNAGRLSVNGALRFV